MNDDVIRILYFSPVRGDAAHDDVFAKMAKNHKLPGTEVHIASLPKIAGGFTHIEYRTYEALVTASILRAVREAALDDFDAFVIGCFYDTGLYDAREISGNMTVTAPCVASCEIAASLANRFGIIVGRRKWVNHMNATVREYGHEHRLSGFYDVELSVNEFQQDHAETERRLIEAGRRAVEEDFAEALILGCTMEVGFYRDIEAQLGVPVIDPSIAALKRAEYGAILKRQCGWKPSRRWSCEAPSDDEIARFGVLAGGEALGRSVVVPAEKGIGAL